MANVHLFSSAKRRTQAAMVRNAAGGFAYALTPRQQLAQLAVTGCLNGTFYASAEAQLDHVLSLAHQVDTVFLAKTAVYARKQGFMKDMPALLLAVLAARDVALFAQVFDQVVDSGKMLRNVVQMLRSGVAGRKSLGTRPKKLVQQWLLQATEKELLHAAVGNQPSLADVVKMVHPKPLDEARAAWFAWLIGKPFVESDLPPLTRAFERFKREGGAVPDVPFQMLTALDLDAQAWAQIARQASWQQVRQGLNMFLRHGVFADVEMVYALADKLCDGDLIAKARVFPYQLLTAYQSADSQLPNAIRQALHDAMDWAVANVPMLAGHVVVCPDVSGSMLYPVSGYRGSASSKTRCIDVAALVAAAVLRKNAQARVLPFETKVKRIHLDAHAPILDNAAQLAKLGGGGTNCSAPLALLNREKADVDVVVLVSDNESWADPQRPGSTAMMREWQVLKARCPQAKLVCIDLTPYPTSQMPNREDVLNIGGFSDQVFRVLARFVSEGHCADAWLREIDGVALTIN